MNHERVSARDRELVELLQIEPYAGKQLRLHVCNSARVFGGFVRWVIPAEDDSKMGMQIYLTEFCFLASYFFANTQSNRRR
jgi:hypothetical protein